MTDTDPITPDGPSRDGAPQMFDRIAHRYDFLNRLLSGRRDVVWRKRLARMLPTGASIDVLDLATGTADVLIAVEETGRIGRGVGMDLSTQMLDVGRGKLAERGMNEKYLLMEGDAVEIPAEDASYDAVTIAFGIRNVLDVGKSLREMRRVLKPGGRALVLECSVPENTAVRAGYLVYFRHVLPILGGMISGDSKAYRYLNETVESFPCGDAFLALMDDAGFEELQCVPMTLGVASIYRGDKPG